MHGQEDDIKCYLEKRETLDDELRRSFRTLDGAKISNALRLINQLDKTYSKNNLIKPEYIESYFALGYVLLTRDKFRDAARMTLKGLKAFRYIITAYPSEEVITKPRLEVQL